MAKYNILREDSEIKKKSDDKNVVKDNVTQRNSEDETAEFSPGSPPETRTPGEKFFTDDIFSAIESDKSSPQTNILGKDEEDDGMMSEESLAPELDFPSEDQADKFDIPDEEPIQADFLPAKEKTKQSVYDYEDYKQEGINYKPILIGLGIVAALVIIYFAVSSLFFGDEAAVPEEKIETAAEKLQREQEERKQNLLVQINKSINQKLGAINLLTGLEKENVKYSSVLLYGNSLDLEVFAVNREALAKFNLKIKDNPRIKAYKMESVDSRPGSQGGIFALYEVDFSQIEATLPSTGQNASIISPSSWESSVQQQSGLNIQSRREISSRSEDLFTINRNEYELKGSFNNCLSLINSLASSNQNISVHKLSLLPQNQQKMSPSSYVLKLVVDYYM